jgi:2-oxoglutarate/2-oxoacid ferredoxin oxidoreductase subunit alpha
MCWTAARSASATSRKAGYAANPLDDGSLAPYVILTLDITRQTLQAVERLRLSTEGRACAAGTCGRWGSPCGCTTATAGHDRLAARRSSRAARNIAEANVAALDAGHAYAETAELPGGATGLAVDPADLPPGVYRTVTGTEAMAWGLTSGLAERAGLERLIFGSYPITPASPVLHAWPAARVRGRHLPGRGRDRGRCAAIGASYAGALGVTSSSGPGIALKTEAIGAGRSGPSLPLVLVNTQRAGPSTGMPTKTEQSDLYQAVYGRNADTPGRGSRPATPADCFEVAVEAVRAGDALHDAGDTC